MGRDLGRAALMRGRARSFGVLLAGALLTAALVATVPGPASADDATPAPTPAPTPSVSPPSQQQIDDAKAALDRLRNQGKNTPTGLTQVAGPTTDEDQGAGTPSITSRISTEAWWTIGAGLLVLVVASETTRVNVRRAKHRKGA